MSVPLLDLARPERVPEAAPAPVGARGDPVPWCRCSTTTLPGPAGAIVVLRIAGEVDVSSRRLVADALAALLDHRPSHLLVDLSGLLFCDVTGLGLLVHAAATAASRGIGYSISAPPRAADRIWALLWPAAEHPVRHATSAAAVRAARAHPEAAGDRREAVTG